VADLIQTIGGKGVVNVLAAEQLMNSPKLYATLLLWLLAEFFEQLPEVGDPDKPKLVFFFDEAHLLFNDAPKALLEKIEQVVRLIRSKGVGVYFVTQNPLDVPDSVLGQLGNRVQHALRAFTPRDQKAVKSAAETMRPNPSFKIEQAITELGVGEALVSLLDEKGRPCVTERALIVPPGSKLGPIDDALRAQLIAASPVAGFYEKAVDRESAYETLKARVAPSGATPVERPRAETRPPPAPASRESEPGRAEGSLASDILFGRRGPRGGRQTQGLIEAMAKSAARTVGSQAGRALIRGVLGSLLGGRR
jgi:DNA helicase HerA-like ATPase